MRRELGHVRRLDALSLDYAARLTSADGRLLVVGR
jgi:hypothetical protein